MTLCIMRVSTPVQRPRLQASTPAVEPPDSALATISFPSASSFSIFSKKDAEKEKDKPYEVSLVLAVVVKKISGNMIFKIKKPPSNRMWPSRPCRKWTSLSSPSSPTVKSTEAWSSPSSSPSSRRSCIQKSVVLPYTAAHEIRDGIFASAFAHPTATFGKREDEVTARTSIDTTSSVEEIAASKSSGVSLSLSDDVPPHEEPDSPSRRQARGRTVSMPSPSTPTSASAYMQDTIRTMFSSSSTSNTSTLLPIARKSPQHNFHHPLHRLLPPLLALHLIRTPSQDAYSPHRHKNQDLLLALVTVLVAPNASNASSSSKDKDKDKDKDGAPSTPLAALNDGRRCGETARVQGGDAQVGRGRELGKGFEEEGKVGNKGKNERDKGGKGGSGDEGDKGADKGGTDREKREDDWEAESKDVDMHVSA
ncbi:hypothetical protein M422DRAFT_251609 [Sphaerobolus stellatus SS14]|uniref:Uncharacterized protein n=1 Tax=Sphaerobolus stellatus (strain SS14) TaxID=990650 RepID=A0A0C9W0M2_SPHS4|nr:hypothetical protein M422DRAFT_251609 [Sphaerobolus stellatus SS14]